MKIVWSCLACLCSATALAQTKMSPKPGDFAMNVPVQVSGQNGVVQFALPLSVYQYALNAELADVRMFDEAGSPVPFALTDSTARPTTEWREAPATLFPVQAEPTADRSGLELDVRAASDGTVLAVHAKRNGKSKAASLQALVLDIGASREHETLDSLQFFLPSGMTTYRGELAVEQSADLKLWDRVAQSRIDWLTDAAQTNSLINDRIELSRHVGRYVRIRWIDGEPVQFARVLARWRTTKAAVDDTLQVTLAGRPGRFPGDWVYSASPALRAQEIGLDLPTANTVLPANIGYYRQQPPPKREWLFIPVAQNTFYRLTQNGSERVSSRIRIYPLALGEWVVRPQSPIAPPPALVLRWKPQTIVFNAQGSAREFVLAFGADANKLRQWTTSLTSLSRVAPEFSAAELARLERATLGEVRSAQLGHVEHVGERADASVSSVRTKILWSVLVVGVLLLAAMTWRLYRQMQTPRGNE